jgi:hypothetical protein
VNRQTFLGINRAAIALLAALLVIPAARADGLRLRGRHLDCEKVSIKLNKAQLRLFRSKKPVALTPTQRARLRSKWNYAPDNLRVLSLSEARESCTCFWENVGVLTGASTVEIPEDLLGKHHAEREPRVRKEELHAWGFINPKGNLVIPHRFRSAQDFKNGMALVDLSDNELLYPKMERFIDKAGKILAPAKAPNVLPAATSTRCVFDFHEGVATFQDDSNKRFGYIKDSGEILVPARFEDADILESGFREGLAPVKVGCKWGYINKVGDFVIPARFAQASQFHDGLAAVMLFEDHLAGVKPCVPSARWTFVTHSGKLWNRAFVAVHNFQEGVTAAMVQEPQQEFKPEEEKTPLHKQLLMRDGHPLNGSIYDDVGHSSGGMVAVRQGNFVGFVDATTGKLAIRPRYCAVGSFSEGVAAVAFQDAGRFLLGYIRKNGTMAIPPRFSISGADFPTELNADENRFRDGCALVRSNGRYGFIDHSGKWIVEPSYDIARSFSEGLAAVCKYAQPARLR